MLKLPTRRVSLKNELKKAGTLLKSLFSLRIVKLAAVLLLFLILAPLILFVLLRPKPQLDINYGVTFSKKYAQELGMDWKGTYLLILDDLKVKNIRLISYWDEVESTRDVYNYADVIWQLEEAQKRNVNVIMTIGRKVPRWPECFEPQWWKELTDSQLQENEQYEYVKETVKALKSFDTIVLWQVENEPFWKFGECDKLEYRIVENEVRIVRETDDKNREIIVQDSGEGGYWYPSYSLGDYLAISMYRKIWYDFWGVFLGRSIYFKYPLAHWSYKIKAELLRVPYEKIKVTELQAEPWGPGINSQLSEYDKNQTMSRNDFLDTISYAQKSGFKDIYLWGVEWWLWEKHVNNNGFYWDTAKALFN